MNQPWHLCVNSSSSLELTSQYTHTHTAFIQSHCPLRICEFEAWAPLLLNVHQPTTRGQCRPFKAPGPPLKLQVQRVKKRYPSLKLAQVVVEGLDVGEDTHGVWFTTHDHHVFHLDQTVAACLRSGDTGRKKTNQGICFNRSSSKTGFWGILESQNLGTIKQQTLMC